VNFSIKNQTHARSDERSRIELPESEGTELTSQPKRSITDNAEPERAIQQRSSLCLARPARGGTPPAISERDTKEKQRNEENASGGARAGTNEPAKRSVSWHDGLTVELNDEELSKHNIKACIKQNARMNTNTMLPDGNSVNKACTIGEMGEQDGGQTVRALVSNIEKLQTGMLQKDVAIGAVVAVAHLDTCATHCFLSHQASKVATAQGYPAYNSSVRYKVEQGNPLCVATKVHVLPLAMIRNDCSVAF
jgi:hypothetical protein